MRCSAFFPIQQFLHPRLGPHALRLLLRELNRRAFLVARMGHFLEHLEAPLRQRQLLFGLLELIRRVRELVARDDEAAGLGRRRLSRFAG